MSVGASESTTSASAGKDVVFHCEHAPSGRARCRVCLNSITKGSLRLAISVPFAEPSLPDPQDENVTKQRRIAAEAPQWCHANCFRRFRASAKWWRTHIDKASRWIGFPELSSSEQAQVRDFVAACEKGEDPPHFSTGEEREERTDPAHAKKEERTRTTKTEERGRRRAQKDESSPSGEISKADSKTGSRKGGDGAKLPRGRAQRRVAADTQAASETPSKNAEGRSRKRTKDEATTGTTPLKQEPSAKQEHATSSQSDAAEESIGLALTPRQRQAIEEELKKAEKETVAMLRALLRMNDQRRTGPKEELAHRVAECRVLGSVPKCPECGVGYLRFDGTKGEYICPGFINDDGEYERCRFKSTEVKRLPWLE